MTPEQLIQEGRQLQRPCSFLQPEGTGPVAAIWYARDAAEIEATGYRCWLTIDASHIPGLPSSITGYVSVFTDEKSFKGGRVEISPSWPQRTGTELYAHPASVLPPIDAVFARGSEAVGEWIDSHGWRRTIRYNDNFKGASVANAYERLWFEEFPLYAEPDVYAVLGGWHWPCADGDWHDFIDDHLMIFTFKDSEPWVEVWHTANSEFRVIQRIS
ncbi:hypothetical protein BH09VER1_BH09VER1_40550 [soil metagenome]